MFFLFLTLPTVLFICDVPFLTLHIIALEEFPLASYLFIYPLKISIKVTLFLYIPSSDHFPPIISPHSAIKGNIEKISPPHTSSFTIYKNYTVFDGPFHFFPPTGLINFLYPSLYIKKILIEKAGGGGGGKEHSNISSTFVYFQANPTIHFLIII